MHCKREEKAKKKLEKKITKIIKSKERKCLYKTKKHNVKNAGTVLWPCFGTTSAISLRMLALEFM